MLTHYLDVCCTYKKLIKIDVWDNDTIIEITMHILKKQLHISKTKLNFFKSETGKDNTFNVLQNYIHLGWPNKEKVKQVVLLF